jgi:hypothetical protein
MGSMEHEVTITDDENCYLKLLFSRYDEVAISYRRKSSQVTWEIPLTQKETLALYHALDENL